MRQQPQRLFQNAARAVVARPWAYACIVAGAVLLCYYASTGFSYWATSRNVDRLEGWRSALIAALADPLPPETAAVRQESLTVTASPFTYANLDRVLAQVMLAAVDAGVSLVSLEAGDLAPLTEGAVIYQALPLSIAVQGNPDQINALVGELHQRLPVAAVGSLRITSLEALPVAQLQYVVYLSPTPAPVKKGTANAAPSTPKP